MRIGVYLTRRTQLKVLGPVATAIQKRGHQLVWHIEQSAVKSGEDLIRVEELDNHWPNEWRAGHYPYGTYSVLIGIGSVLPPRGKTPQIAVDHFFDCWLTPLGETGRVHVYHSDYHRLTYFHLYQPDQWNWSIVPEFTVGWPHSDEVQPPQTRDSVVLL